jgi:16S rRNA (cytosine967-C5)-methyltransferase
VGQQPARSVGVSAPLPSAAGPAPFPAEQRPGVAARAAATVLYSAVLDRRQPLDQLIDPSGGDKAYGALSPRDRRLARAIVATALRRQGEIAAALDRLIERPLPRRAGGLRRILEIAAAQILFMDAADHGVVSVALAQIGDDRNARHFKGLANAVLRRLAREKETIHADLDAPRLNTPDWLWQRWSATYGEATVRRIAEMHLVEPALDLSVKRDPEAWAERLGGIVLPTGSVRLVPSGPVEDLPGCADGEWWVQDTAAALPSRLLEPLGNMRVADLCAAPGGKTAALAHAGARVTAVDNSFGRLNRLRGNLARLKLEAELVQADLLEWTPRELYDRALLDAPCTATGTIRRHPDVAWLKRPEDVASLAALQSRMLDRAVALLKPGGVLLYCTCSLEPEEGEAQLAGAVSRHGLTPMPVEAAEIGGLSEAITPDGTVRTLPCHLSGPEPRLAGLDGFFIGRCRKG